MPFYFDDKEFGYNFHYMDEQIDEGNILLQKAIPIDYNKDIFYHHKILLKTFKESIPILLDKLEKKEKGISQDKLDSYFGEKEIDKIKTITDLSKFSYKELQNIIKIFGHFMYKTCKVTKINKNKKVLGVNYLPLWIYRILRKKLECVEY